MTLPPYYDQGGVAIYHGDCVEILPQLAAESIDLVLTDPPYLVGFTGRWGGERRAVVGDNDASWVRPAFTQAWRVLKKDTFCVSFYGWPHAEVFLTVWKAIGFRPVSHIAFVKNVWGFGRFTRGQHEVAYLLAKGDPPIPDKGISDVIEWMRDQDAVHPCQKPLGAFMPLLETFAPKGGVVLDPFMGSGTVLRAAKDCNLKAIGIDVEERWCAYAAGRIAQGALPF